jgi:hypothetical protein
VQEIGKARRIKIYHDGRETEWNDFITQLQEYEKFPNCIPLKLAKQLEKKIYPRTPPQEPVGDPPGCPVHRTAR